MANNYKLTHTGPEVDSAVGRALPGGEIDTQHKSGLESKYEIEFLDNTDFTNPVAQAGVGGLHGSVAYAVDRWKLLSGTVSASSDGLTLNGTIRQILEKSIGFTVVPSIEMHSGTATITYDDATKQFDITSSGGTIKRAHLGLIAITDWSKMPLHKYDEVLQRSRWYYERGVITLGLSGRTDVYAATSGIQYKAQKRTEAVVQLINPHTGLEGSVYDSGNGNSYGATASGGISEFSIVFTETGFSAFDAMRVGYEAISDL